MIKSDVMVKESGGSVEAVCLNGVLESMTVKVCVVVPIMPVSGVPLIVPGEATLNCSPFGKLGSTDHV